MGSLLIDKFDFKSYIYFLTAFGFLGFLLSFVLKKSNKDDYDFFIIDNDENLQKLKDIFSLFVIEDISFSKFNNVPVISSISFIIKKNK